MALSTTRTAGSVVRCAANHRLPPTHNTAAAVTPAAGCTWVASRVTRAGPSTKHTSSATDSRENAVCSRGESASSALHRARAIGPSAGIAAPPSAPATNSAQSGAPACTATTSPATETAKMRHSGISTRCWPCRSTRRPICGEQSAPASDPAADTLPATA